MRSGITKVIFLSILFYFFISLIVPVYAASDQKYSPIEYHEIAEERLQLSALFYERWQNSGKPEAFQQAVVYASSAARIRPEWDEPWVLLGSLYAELKADQKAMELAVEALLNAVEVNPANARAQIMLANVLLEQGRFYSAIEQYKSLFAKNNNMITGITITPLTIAYIADERTEAGINYLRELLQLYPDNYYLKVGLAVLLKNNGKRSEALNILSEMIMTEYLTENDKLSQDQEKYLIKLRDKWEQAEMSEVL